MSIWDFFLCWIGALTIANTLFLLYAVAPAVKDLLRWERDRALRDVEPRP